jgi:TPP-dependent pyruvate/acetoin dehydrogenase alpha subunit
LRESGELSAEELAHMTAEVRREIDAAVDFAERSPAPAQEALLEDLFA